MSSAAVVELDVTLADMDDVAVLRYFCALAREAHEQGYREGVWLGEVRLRWNALTECVDLVDGGEDASVPWAAVDHHGYVLAETPASQDSQATGGQS